MWIFLRAPRGGPTQKWEGGCLVQGTREGQEPEEGLAPLQTLYQIAAMQNPPVEMMDEEMNQLNVGPYVTDPMEKLGNMLRKYRKIFAFTPRELWHTKIKACDQYRGSPLVHVSPR